MITNPKFISSHSNTENKHIGINDPLPTGAAGFATVNHGDAKPLSPNAEQARDTTHAPYNIRAAMTQEEIDTINEGTNECLDWEKIKLEQ